MVIFAVISRDANSRTNADAIAILSTNTTAISLNGWSLQVRDATGTVTASASFGAIVLQPWEQVIVTATDYRPAPILPHTNVQGFNVSEATDAIEDGSVIRTV